MASCGVKTLIYSSTCATYGEPEKMPITEATPQVVTSRTETLHSEILYICVFHHLVFLLLKRIILGCTEMLHSFIWYLWVLCICLCEQSVTLLLYSYLVYLLPSYSSQLIHMERRRKWRRASYWISRREQTWLL
jgi:hypothetical protein